WEIGLSETHQTLVAEGLRDRVVVGTDGKMMTGRDVVIAALLGAEEYGFSTAALVTQGCIMMRKCHLNTCPVGIATQDPDLRKKFTGQPEYLVRYLTFVATEVREIMAAMGFRTIEEMIGQVDRIRPVRLKTHWKARGLELSKILNKPKPAFGTGLYCSKKQDHGLDEQIDHVLIEKAKPALEKKEPTTIEIPVQNTDRTVGAMLSGEIAKKYG
ncbi:MAG: glutamate synthase subunit alpha, partial [Leptospiraceae bacterium]|nr:glutamate synthase subunit alpha [Leptospiraceae bacterium]